jgi:hypothetical protein
MAGFSIKLKEKKGEKHEKFDDMVASFVGVVSFVCLLGCSTNNDSHSTRPLVPNVGRLPFAAANQTIAQV